jgi:NADH:ubiquinone oxidoreductase subunit 3 (subunit A)
MFLPQLTDMNQYLKMFLFVLIACWILIIPGVSVQYLILYHKYEYEQNHLPGYIIQAWVYSIPLVLLIFFMLLSFNAIMKHKAGKNNKKKWNKDYYMVGLLFVAVIPVALIIFEYTQRGRYLNESDFWYHIYGYLFFIVFGFVLLIVNKGLFWSSK